VERLGHEVERARAHGPDALPDGALRGQHDDGRLRVQLARASEHLETIRARHHEVRDHQIEGSRPEFLDGRHAVLRLDDPVFAAREQRA
jgi:hypothetical protein